MQLLFGSIFLVVASSICLPAQTQTIKNDQDSVLIKQLSDLEFELNDLLAERNFDTYATYLADDYIRISANGNIMNKEQVLQQFRTAQTGKAVPEILQIRIYGNTAVMTIHLTITTEEHGKTFVHEALLTKVFILKEGQWYMVSNQGTAITNK